MSGVSTMRVGAMVWGAKPRKRLIRLGGYLGWHNITQMSRLAVNLLANLAGQGWSIIISLLVIPLYIRLLGIEAYGLIGFYALLQALSQVLDLGLSPTINREMARYSDQPAKADEARDLVRTLEVAYWAIGVGIGGGLIMAAPWIAHHWVKASAIAAGDVQHALMLIGVVVALQWPVSFYASGLIGLQKQLLRNTVAISMSALGNGGAVLILWGVSPTVRAFFTWQVFVAAVQLATICLLMWRSLPPGARAPRVDLRLVQNVWRFAAGMEGLGLSAIVLTQLDKVILSKLLSLETFGYYTAAGVLGRSLYVLISPVFDAFFPRFSALVALDNESGLKRLYHRGSQLMASLVIPTGTVVSLFSYSILLLWTGNADTALHGAPIASLLVIGTALNGLMNLPYALQLAYGWTGLGLAINSCFVIGLVPALVYATLHFGPVGAAGVWAALNTIYLIVGVPLTHRRLLRGEAWAWFRTDIGLPLLATLPVVALARSFLVGPPFSLASPRSLVLVLLCALFAATAAAPEVREWMRQHLARGVPNRSRGYFWPSR
jgi:O-antigen/teichoic acid export membrane protein